MLDTFSVRPIPWDSDFFGFSVASIHVPHATDSALRSALTTARREGVKVAYLFVSPSDVVAVDTLTEFRGQLVDEKVTFSRSLISSESFDHASDRTVEYYPLRAPDESLLALAEAAGIHSRFRVDPRFGIDNWRRLYHVWITRSTLGEIADAVLISRSPESSDRIVGVITIRRTDDKGIIGLLAVAEEYRGHGYGRRLLDAAEARCHTWGIRDVSVTTQLANQAACRLYRSAAYKVASLAHVYHFWL